MKVATMRVTTERIVKIHTKLKPVKKRVRRRKKNCLLTG
jgi:hypothetical protein